MVKKKLIDKKESERILEEILTHISNKENFLLSGGAGSGKTYTLVQVIQSVLDLNPTEKIACITYTNAAVKEIKERVNHPNLKVSTIHDFLWDIISGFKTELKRVLINLINDPEEPLFRIDGEAYILDTYFDHMVLGVRYLEYKKLREAIISHDELLVLANKMFQKYRRLCDIFKDKYKFLFVDEYQDTSPYVIELLLEHLTQSTRHNIIGFFGDSMQSIYDDGVGDINKYILDGRVKEVIKVQNRRNPQLVINLANELRTDNVKQTPSDNLDAPNMKDDEVKQGCIQFIYSKSTDLNKLRQYLGWNFKDPKVTKELNLTHNLIAEKAGFKALMDIYDKDQIIKYLGLLRKYIRLINYSYNENISLNNLINNLKIQINEEINNFGLKSFTVLKYIEYLKIKYPIHSKGLDDLLSKIKPIDNNTIKAEQISIIDEFKQKSGLVEIDYVYRIKLMKDIEKGISSDYTDLYSTIEYELYSKVKDWYAKSDQLVDDKKQEIEDENKKGSKRDNLIKHLFKIQDIISDYQAKKHNDFLRKTGYKFGTIQEKKILKEKIDSLTTDLENKKIEDIIKVCHGEEGKSICTIDERLIDFIQENEYLYNRVKKVPYKEFQCLYNYLEGYTPFSTQHKTKGAEFNNVLVILDDGKWNKYDFKALFSEGNNEGVLKRTQKIFYVCCTRAKDNLAVFFHDPSDQIIEKANIWFNKNVIDLDTLTD
ncbi:ATP-dependent helicase [Dysgonomonas capnocytophagoides]|uniref:DNA 3'-5' helicase II n=1 Tax=Dysgonomonas capnocytophagoides TaxID=45254 RepID=A0A4Y8L3T2_9BACT|nr:UvrD-helicase domain-containing protein [Dysgonomonas capnocytophagoides]TFD97329.1 ATP-dependent helicase [Dysgonomonas capnocytophagoides]